MFCELFAAVGDSLYWDKAVSSRVGHAFLQCPNVQPDLNFRRANDFGSAVAIELRYEARIAR